MGIILSNLTVSNVINPSEGIFFVTSAEYPLDNVSSGAGIAVTIPTAAAPGDLAIVVAGTAPGGNTWSVTGWNELTDSGSVPNHFVAWRNVVSGDPGTSWTFFPSTGSSGDMAIYIFRNALYEGIVSGPSTATDGSVSHTFSYQTLTAGATVLNIAVARGWVTGGVLREGSANSRWYNLPQYDHTGSGAANHIAINLATAVIAGTGQVLNQAIQWTAVTAQASNISIALRERQPIRIIATQSTTNINNTITPTLGATPQVGDLVLVFLSTQATGAQTWTAPSGWTEVADAGAAPGSSIAYRIWATGDTAVGQFLCSTADTLFAHTVIVRDAAYASATAYTTSGSGTSITVADTIAPTANCLGFIHYVTHNDGGAALTVPSDLVQVTSLVSGTYRQTIFRQYRSTAGAGTGSRTITRATSSGASGGALVLVRPAITGNGI